MDRPILSIRDLTVQFAADTGWVTAVENVALDIPQATIVGLVGESGSGKSVTAMSVMRLLPEPGSRISSGEVWFEGKDLLHSPANELRDIRGRRIGCVFQDPTSSFNPAFTVGHQIAEVGRRHLGISRRAAWRRAEEMLALVGVGAAGRRVHDYPHSFSGGMLQRAMIAMALVCEPALLIADEPTTALDVTVQARILEQLMRLQDELGMSVLLITHDLSIVAETCDHVIVMYAGEVVESAEVAAVYDRPRHPYTQGLLDAMPILDDQHATKPMPGFAPQPGAYPDGCRFGPRCAHFVDGRCAPERIPLRTAGPAASRCVRADELRLPGLGPAMASASPVADDHAGQGSRTARG